MTLKEIIELEEIVLNLLSKCQFMMDFNDIVILHKELDTISKITCAYFNLTFEYSKFIEKERNDANDNVSKLEIFNDKLLNSQIDYNSSACNSVVSKYKDIYIKANNNQ